MSAVGGFPFSNTGTFAPTGGAAESYGAPASGYTSVGGLNWNTNNNMSVWVWVALAIVAILALFALSR